MSPMWDVVYRDVPRKTRNGLVTRTLGPMVFIEQIQTSPPAALNTEVRQGLSCPVCRSADLRVSADTGILLVCKCRRCTAAFMIVPPAAGTAAH